MCGYLGEPWGWFFRIRGRKSFKTRPNTPYGGETSCYSLFQRGVVLISTSVMNEYMYIIIFVVLAHSISVEEPVRRSMDLDNLKLSIRCLSLTTWYFVSQIAIFLPGTIYFGCDKEIDVSTNSHLYFTYDEWKLQIYGLFQDEHDFLDTCGKILNSEIRIFIFIFYQLQFLKPFFFLLFDTELYRVVVRNLFECSGPVYNVWSSSTLFFKVKMIWKQNLFFKKWDFIFKFFRWVFNFYFRWDETFIGR